MLREVAHEHARLRKGAVANQTMPMILFGQGRKSDSWLTWKNGLSFGVS